MARYEVPKVYYQPYVDGNSAVEVTYMRSLSWENRTNNNGAFQIVLPMDKALTPVEPIMGGYIRLGDTLMMIEKKERIIDEKGVKWFRLGGRPYQQTDEVVRDAKNEGYFFRYAYDGIGASRYKTFRKGESILTIEKGDIVTSQSYDDMLGGFVNILEDTVNDSFSWGTIVLGQQELDIAVDDSSYIAVSGTVPVNAIIWHGNMYAPYDSRNITPDSRANTTLVGTGILMGKNKLVNRKFGVAPNQVDKPVIKVQEGNASGVLGYMNTVTVPFNNVAEVRTENLVAYTNNEFYTYVNPPWSGIQQYENDPIQTGTIWMVGNSNVENPILTYTAIEYEEMIREWIVEQNQNPNPFLRLSGSVEKGMIQSVTQVTGGHAGYKFTIKSRGEVDVRYNVDFKIGDTITVNDTRLGIIYTDVVTGGIEKIDSSGYSVEIELGTLGATITQRFNRVI